MKKIVFSLSLLSTVLMGSLYAGEKLLGTKKIIVLSISDGTSEGILPLSTDLILTIDQFTAKEINMIEKVGYSVNAPSNHLYASRTIPAHKISQEKYTHMERQYRKGIILEEYSTFYRVIITDFASEKSKETIKIFSK